MGFIVEQYINPIVQNSQHSLEGDLLNAIERVLKLSVPTLYVEQFYKDWWNAKTVEEYWRMWNMGLAVVISFFISAIFHELCIAVPCQIFKFWAFVGIMLQITLVIFTKYLQNKFRNTMVGNTVFWFCFSILGQPMCLLLYYHDSMNQRVRTQ